MFGQIMQHDINPHFVQAMNMAFAESNKLGLTPSIDLNVALNKSDETVLTRWCLAELLPFLADKHPHDYWGEQCINLTAQTFALLQALDVECEIVMGEVNINGTDEFDTTLSGLKDEFAKGISNDPLAIHVWIQLGNNFVIDPSICARLRKYYMPTFPVPHIVTGFVSDLFNMLKLEYKPMLVGAKYITETCGIPLEYSSNTRRDCPNT